MEARTEGTPTALQDCLARCGTDHSTLVTSVDRAVGLRRGDLLLAVGSLVEGLGNRKSDLDLLLVAGNGDPGRAETERGWPIGRCLVDLRIVRATTVEALISRLREWARLRWDLTELAPFSYEERLLLHRLLEGAPVYPGQPAPTVFPWRPGRAELARLKLHIARHMARTIQVDMVGYRDESDYASLVFAAQDLLGHGVDGLLAGHHLTNPNPKWRSRLLERLPPDWDQSLRMRPTGLPAGRAVWGLHRAPPEPESGSAISHALRCTTFTRAVFAWAEPHLVGNSTLGTASCSWRPEEVDKPVQPLPSLEFDVDFFFSDKGIAVARLNEFGASLRLSEQEFTLLLLFDGQTSAVEADTVVNGAMDDHSEWLDVDRTIELVKHSGLCLPAQQLSRAYA